MTEAEVARPAAIDRRGSLAVTVSTLVAGVSGYVIIWVAADVLGPAGYARFQVFWGLYFALLGVLFGLQQESTRAASASTDPAAPVPRPGPTGAAVRIVPTSLAIGVAAGLLVAVTSPLWATAVFPEHATPMVAVVAVAAVLYAGQTGLLGALSGTRRWGTVATVITAEAVLRVVAVLVAAAAGWGLLGMSVATGVAAVAWLAVLVAPRARAALATRADAPRGPFLRQAGHAMVAAASSAALVMGFPTLLEATTPGDLGEAAGPLLIAVTLTRAPLLVPMNAFQGVAINHFVAHRSGLLRATVVPGLGLALVGAVGAGLAWLVGDPLITAVFGDDFHNPPWLLAALMGAATLVAGLTLTGAAVLSAGRHRAYVSGWVVATIVFVGVLLVPGTLEARTVASLTIGPLAGILVHVLALRPPRPGVGA